MLRCDILLTKLKNLGVSGKMLNWFLSYLDRTQRVRHNGQMSDELKFKCGIPQGSCLGPTLFIFYINDIFRCIDNDVKVMMFADDCVIYNSNKCCNVMIEKLQYGLDKYIEWGRNNNMHLNTSKTKAMLIPPQNDVNRPLVAGDKQIQYVHTFNYLGVILDDQLSLTPYYHLVKRRIRYLYCLKFENLWIVELLY